MLPDNAEESEERKYLIFTLLELEQSLLKSIMDITGVPDDVLQDKMQLLFSEMIRLIKRAEDLEKDDKVSYLDYCIRGFLTLNKETDSCNEENPAEKKRTVRKKKSKENPAGNQMEGQFSLFDNIMDQ